MSEALNSHKLEAWFNEYAPSLSVEAVLDFNEAMGWIPPADEPEGATA